MYVRNPPLSVISLCKAALTKIQYVWMANGNNQEWTEEPPTYNSRYGFSEGAQNDIFATAAAAAAPASSTSTSKTATTATPASTSRVSTQVAAVTGGTVTVTRTVTVSACATVKVSKRHEQEKEKRKSTPPMGMNRLRAHPRDFGSDSDDHFD